MTTVIGGYDRNTEQDQSALKSVSVTNAGEKTLLDVNTDVALTTKIEMWTTGYGSGQAKYIGKAAPGTATSESTWQIQKIDYDVTRQPNSITFAEGVATFTKEYDDRDTYSYS